MFGYVLFKFLDKILPLNVLQLGTVHERTNVIVPSDLPKLEFGDAPRSCHFLKRKLDDHHLIIIEDLSLYVRFLQLLHCTPLYWCEVVKVSSDRLPQGGLGGSSLLDNFLSIYVAADSERVLKYYGSSYVVREQDPSTFSFAIGLHMKFLV